MEPRMGEGTGYSTDGTLEASITVTADEYRKLGSVGPWGTNVNWSLATFNSDGSVTLTMNAFPPSVPR